MKRREENATLKKRKNKVSAQLDASLKAGAIALVFLVLGYQTALFVHKAAVTKIISNRDCPDTVFISALPSDSQPADRQPVGSQSSGSQASGTQAPAGNASIGQPAGSQSSCSQSPAGLSANSTEVIARKNSQHSPEVEKIRELYPSRNPEVFRFNPNTVSIEDLQRLGFSLKQARSIDNYRRKGGRFARKSDFAKSYVVSEETFRRLEDYIDIPLLDINMADSAAFDALPGIGGWFASAMVRHREELGGYNSKRQLLNIYRMDEERYGAISDLVFVSSRDARPFRLWSLPADSLRLHPYIRKWQTAKDIVLYRDHNPRERWSLDALLDAGVIDSVQYVKLSRTLLEPVSR